MNQLKNSGPYFKTEDSLNLESTPYQDYSE